MTQLNGKWSTFSEEDGYFELWISDSLSLGYGAEVGALYLNSIERTNEKMTFKLIESDIYTNPEYSVEILRLDETALKTEFIGPTLSERIRTYKRISSVTPKIFPSLERNEKFRPEFFSNAETHYRTNINEE